MRTGFYHQTPSRLLSVIFAAMGALAGCAGEKITAPSITPESSGSTVATTLPAEAVLHAGELQPLARMSHLFEASAGPHAGQRLTATIEPVAPKKWQYTLEATRVVFLEQTADGAIVIPREQDVAEAVDIFYDPPIPLLPAELSVSKPVQGASKMTVRNLHGGGVRDKGTCGWQVELKGRREVVTPGGKFDAYIVEGTRQIRLGLATVDVATLTAYEHGLGTVAESVTEKTLALGLVGGTKQEVLKFVK